MPLNLDDPKEMKDLAQTHSNQAILKGQANIVSLTETINSEIDHISDLRILEGIENILLTMRSEKDKLVKGVVGSLGEIKKKWQTAPYASEPLIKASLHVFQNYFADRFKDEENKPNLCGFDSDGVFAKNIISHLPRDPMACKGIMNSFCDYNLALSYLSNEEIVTKLESFPPKIAADINCLGGSGSDIDDLIKKMTVSSEDKILFEIHQLLSMQIVSKFNKKVYKGNHKHTPPCLSFILGVESKDVIINVILDQHYKLPRRDISTHLAHDEIHHYFKSFKKHLKNNEGVTAEIRNASFHKIRMFQDKYNANNLALATNTDAVGQNNLDIRNTLSAEEKIPVTSLMQEDEEGNYIWDEEKITQHVVRTSFNKFFPEYPSQDIHKPSAQDEDLLQRLNNNSNLFTDIAQQDVILALKSKNNDILSVGIRNLWLIGAKFSSNSPIQFTNIMDTLIDPEDGSLGIFTYEDETRKTIKLNPEFTINLSIANRDKLAEIPEYYQAHMTNQDVLNYKLQQGEALQKPPLFSRLFPCPKLITLLNGNASKEEVLACLNEFKELNIVQDAKLSFSKNDLDISTLNQLIERPDKIEILRAIKNAGIKLSDNSLQYFSNAALSNKDLTLYKAILEIIDRKDDSLLSSDLIHAVLDNNTEIALFLITSLQHIKSPEILKKDLEKPFAYSRSLRGRRRPGPPSHGSLIHVATSQGNLKIINALVQNGVDLNQKNLFRPKLPHLSKKDFAPTSGQTPAHVAATYGRTKVIKLLRKLGANLDLHDSYGDRPIHCAIKGGYATTLKALIEVNNAEEQVCITRKPFIKTEYTGHFKNLPNIKKSLSHLIEFSPAIIAARYLQLQCLKQLFDHGLVLNAAELNRMSQIVTNRINFDTKHISFAGSQYLVNQHIELLEFLCRKGASSPYAPVPALHIKKTLDKHDHFESIARAITKFARNNLKESLFADDRELVTFKNEICRQLIATYDFNPEQMLEDFELTKKSDRLLPSGSIRSHEDVQRANLPRFKLDLEKKYQHPIGEKAEILGEILADKITSTKQRPLSKFPLTKTLAKTLAQTKFSLSEENAQSFLEILSSSDDIKNAMSSPKLKQKPKTTIRSSSRASTQHFFGARVKPEEEMER